jgi:transposase
VAVPVWRGHSCPRTLTASKPQLQSRGRHIQPKAIHTILAVWFAYSPDRKGEHPERHLHGFRGWLQADAFAGFNRLYKEDGGIQEVACWAHVRRKFYDFQEAPASPIASEALERIAALYAIEKEIRGRPPDERHQVRATRARPLLQSLHEWFEASRVLALPQKTTSALPKEGSPLAASSERLR